MNDGVRHAIITNGSGIEKEADPDQFALAEKFDDGRADVGTERKTENLFSCGKFRERRAPPSAPSFSFATVFAPE
jgi:hypothetical protein